jgi:hypothetical protein
VEAGGLVKKNWWETEDGRAQYLAAREIAQRDANEDGFDRGIERNDAFKYFRVFMLPQKKNRYGHELRCEVVMCEKLEKCQPGHGPL